MSTIFAANIVIGLVIGIIGGIKQWGPVRTGALAFFFSLAFNLVASGLVHAESASNTLRRNALILPSGSGSIVEAPSGKRYLLTNWHVCLVDVYKYGLYGFHGNGDIVITRLTKVDPKSDLCAGEVLSDNTYKTSHKTLHIAPFVRLGEPVYTRGYPMHILVNSNGTLGTNVQWDADFPIESVGTCPPGFMRHLDFTGKTVSCSFTFSSTLSSLYARPGSSGSPVVNRKGELIGVVSSWHTNKTFEAGLVNLKDIQEFFKGL